MQQESNKSLKRFDNFVFHRMLVRQEYWFSSVYKFGFF